MPIDVAREWGAAVTALGGSAAVAQASATDLVARYAEPHRRYHDLRHVAAVVREVSWLAGEVRLDGRDRALAVLAGCAHDVVYDARPGEDERASARWARDRLAAAGVPAGEAERVAGLVLATLEHTAVGDDLPAAVLLDADLAVLGSDADTYARYVADVRAEYATVPDTAWRDGRGRVLAALAARQPLYLTEPARRRWDGPARRNLAEELRALRP